MLACWGKVIDVLSPSLSKMRVVQHLEGYKCISELSHGQKNCPADSEVGINTYPYLKVRK